MSGADKGTGQARGRAPASTKKSQGRFWPLSWFQSDSALRARGEAAKRIREYKQKLEEANARLAEAAAEKRKLADMLNGRIAGLRDKLNDARQKLDTAIRQRNDAVRVRDGKIEQLKALLAEARAQRSAAAEAKRTTLAMLNKRVAQLQQTVVAQRADLRELAERRREVERLKDSADQLRRRVERYEKR